MRLSLLLRRAWWALMVTATITVLIKLGYRLSSKRALASCGSTSQYCLRQRLRRPLSWKDRRLLNHILSQLQPPPSLNNTASPERGNIRSRLWEAQHPPWANVNSFNSTETYIRLLAGSQRGGVFVEVGAEDGLWLSNTWWLEAELEWRGVLIEADPRNYMTLRASPRQSHILPLCVTSELRIGNEVMVQSRSPNNSTLGLLKSQVGRTKMAKYATRQELMVGNIWTTTCFPLASVLAALKYFQIDLLTFDLAGGGMEMTLLFLSVNQSLGYPFQIKLVLYRHSQLSQFFDLGEVRENFARLGYTLIKIGLAHYLLYDKSIILTQT